MILKKLRINAGIIDDTNCYIIVDEETKEAIVIDPAGNANEILEMLNILEAKTKYIVITHCHFDHVGGVEDLKAKTDAKVLAHRYSVLKLDSILDDSDIIHIGNLEFKIIHTPGHAQDAICIYCKTENMLFSGDTIFYGTWGRTDLANGSHEEIMLSIKEKLMVLPEETIVYPGHRKTHNDKRRESNVFRR